MFLSKVWMILLSDCSDKRAYIYSLAISRELIYSVRYAIANLNLTEFDSAIPRDTIQLTIQDFLLISRCL